MREIVHLQAGQCGNQIGAKVSNNGIDYDIIPKKVAREGHTLVCMLCSYYI